MAEKTLTDRQKNDQERKKKLIQKIKIAQKQLNIDDESYRALMINVTGHPSSTQCEPWQLENVMQRLRQLGLKDKTANQAGARRLAGDGQSKKIRSLWLELHADGKVNDPSERALVNWAKGQFKTTGGIEALQWFNVEKKRMLIEQLKRWQARAKK